MYNPHNPTGNELPSVTELLPKQQFFVTPEQLENARIEGVTNHAMVKLYLETRKTFNDPYLEEFAEFWEQKKGDFGKVIALEKPLISERYQFRGTPDIVCTNAIVDLKRTRGEKKRHALQLAGYIILARENKLLDEDVPLYVIFRDTKFRIIDVTNPVAEKVFLSLVQRHYAEIEINNYFSRNHTGRADASPDDID